MYLLDLLNNGGPVGIRRARDRLDVDSEVFPILCEQVPLFVLEHKQQRQEPVKGGIFIRRVSLPVASSVRRFGERTAFGTAVRRLRQIITTVAVGCVVFLLFARLLGYCVEADRNGNIRLHHGTKWLAPHFDSCLPFVWTPVFHSAIYRTIRRRAIQFRRGRSPDSGRSFLAAVIVSGTTRSVPASDRSRPPDTTFCCQPALLVRFLD